MNTLIFDIEADGFLYEATTIWCMVGYCLEDGQYFIYHVDTEEEVCYPTNTTYIDSIDKYKVLFDNYRIIGHNILNYDLPLLSKLAHYKYSLKDKEDTLVMSRLSFPDREGHKLEWWGEKFRFPKGNHKDFSRFSPEMLTYCIQDVMITKRVWEFLQEEMKDWDWSEALKIEYAMANLQTIQEQTGIMFDIELAKSIVYNLDEEIKSIEETVIPSIPMKYKHTGDINKPFKKDGSYSEQANKWMNL